MSCPRSKPNRFGSTRTPRARFLSPLPSAAVFARGWRKDRLSLLRSFFSHRVRQRSYWVPRVLLNPECFSCSPPPSPFLPLTNARPPFHTTLRLDRSSPIVPTSSLSQLISRAESRQVFSLPVYVISRRSRPLLSERRSRSAPLDAALFGKSGRLCHRRPEAEGNRVEKRALRRSCNRRAQDVNR